MTAKFSHGDNFCDGGPSITLHTNNRWIKSVTGRMLKNECFTKKVRVYVRAWLSIQRLAFTFSMIVLPADSLSFPTSFPFFFFFSLPAATNDQRWGKVTVATVYCTNPYPNEILLKTETVSEEDQAMEQCRKKNNCQAQIFFFFCNVPSPSCAISFSFFNSLFDKS